MRVATMEWLLTATASERRFAMIVFEAFALVALLLAATGLYGVLSGSVAERKSTKPKQSLCFLRNSKL
jgi:ABC-type antimicrobial peptide transport system permease subunit